MCIQVNKNGEQIFGLVGFIGWKRLVELLESSGEVQADEYISELTYKCDGVRFKIKKKEKASK